MLVRLQRSDLYVATYIQSVLKQYTKRFHDPYLPMVVEAHCSTLHVLDIPVKSSLDRSSCDDNDGGHLEKAGSADPRFGKFPNNRDAWNSSSERACCARFAGHGPG